jgi:hypothetical protein
MSHKYPRPSFETPRKRAAPQDDGGVSGYALKRAIKFVHLVFRHKIAAPRSVHPRAYRGSFFIGQPVDAAATRFDFAGDIGELFLVFFRPALNPLQQCFCFRTHAIKLQSTFAGTGFSVAAFATRAAFAVSASAAIFFCGSEPGCTTPQDMIRVAASSALISTSISLLFGT